MMGAALAAPGVPLNACIPDTLVVQLPGHIPKPESTHTCALEAASHGQTLAIKGVDPFKPVAHPCTTAAGELTGRTLNCLSAALQVSIGLPTFAPGAAQ